MTPRGFLYWALVIIAISTLISGLVQMISPAFVLGIVMADQSSTAKHFFAIVGMFMALFGGMLLQALWGAESREIVYFWSGLQKLGASAAVALGVMNHIFALRALAIAGFDLLSGVLVFFYLMSTRNEPATQWKPQGVR